MFTILNCQNLDRNHLEVKNNLNIGIFKGYLLVIFKGYFKTICVIFSGFMGKECLEM